MGKLVQSYEDIPRRPYGAPQSGYPLKMKNIKSLLDEFFDF